MEPDWKAIAATIRHHSATFYYGSLLFRGAARKGVWAVYAACRTGDDAVDESSDPEGELERWWEGIERAYRAQPQEEWEKGLAWAFERWPIPQAAFADMHRGFLDDLRPMRPQNLEELLLYCYRVAGTVGRMIAPIAGVWPGAGGAEEAAVKLGQAMQLTNCLRDVGEDLAIGRVYLPADLMDRHGVSLEDLYSGRIRQPYIGLMQELAAAARRLYREGLKGLPYLRQGRAAIALAALQYEGILDKLERSGWNNLSGRASLRAYERLLLVPRALWMRTGSS
ncbi:MULTISPECIES: phytoene/squalene synthase family protein [unclassified Meiothermus]|uniref:phytoene/squalene synthase family protein n=1 Tax=unclassified Meiothermus TaxID=370471 RepID=UPI000D7BA4BA|nr:MULTISPECIES: phytoene/squalene synthase family protein [unclassified Meiothermus]PZA08820.1 phytoene synthase [Meiothermus sp. Pnk-1]RYM40557.1 squalene/phytoene synthase family protein [Meiothermus sp. PNK-Is4]